MVDMTLAELARLTDLPGDSPFDAYNKRWPGTLPDAFQLSEFQFANLADFVQGALDRGSPLTPRDFGRAKWDTANPSEGIVI
jgi:hypothetical protein